jgi:N-acetylmuramic acid 6-phosphate etherase
VGGEVKEILTEQRNPATMDLDRMSALEIVTVMNAEDAKVARAVEDVLPQIARAVELIVQRLADGGRLLYVGAGTSGRLGVLDASECVPTFSVPPTMVQGLIAGGKRALTTSVEEAEDDREAGARAVREEARATSRDVVVGIAASGRTPYVVGALQAARSVGAVAVALACTTGSPLAQAADVAIELLVGPEVLTGSTRLKAGTAQKMALNMLSTAAMIRLGKAYQNLMVDLKATNSKLRARARWIVRTVTGCSEEEAGRLLSGTGYRVKPALVMAVAAVNRQEAERRLEVARGWVGRAIAGEE